MRFAHFNIGGHKRARKHTHTLARESARARIRSSAQYGCYRTDYFVSGANLITKILNWSWVRGSSECRSLMQNSRCSRCGRLHAMHIHDHFELDRVQQKGNKFIWITYNCCQSVAGVSFSIFITVEIFPPLLPFARSRSPPLALSLHFPVTSFATSALWVCIFITQFGFVVLSECRATAVKCSWAWLVCLRVYLHTKNNSARPKCAATTLNW